MEEDWEKTLILLVTFVIIGGFMISPKIKEISFTKFFALFLILFFICVIQTHYLKKWSDDENKTDYNLAYWIYCVISVVLFLYLIYILGLNPNIKSMKGGAQFAYDSNINITSQNKVLEVTNKSLNTLIRGVQAYTNFWKNTFSKLFNKNNTYVEGTI